MIGIGRDQSSVGRVRAVYEAEHARLWRALYAFTRSHDVADEASAEAFAQVLRRGDEVRDVAAWVWRSAFAIARGELQRRRRTGEAVVVEPVEATVDGLSGQLDALSSLSEADRELIVLCHVAGWSPGELAGVLGVSAGAVRVRLHRATRQARSLLEQADRSVR